MVCGLVGQLSSMGSFTTYTSRGICGRSWCPAQLSPVADRGDTDTFDHEPFVVGIFGAVGVEVACPVRGHRPDAESLVVLPAVDGRDAMEAGAFEI